MLGLIAVAAACLLMLAPIPATVIERRYTNGFYAVLQPFATTISNTVPLALLDLLLLGAVALGPIVAVRWWRSTSPPLLRRGAVGVWRLSVFAALVYVAFLVAWGFNYRRVPAEERARVDSSRITSAALGALAQEALTHVNRLAAAADSAPVPPDELVARLSPAFAAAEAWLGKPWHATPGRPKVSAIALAFPLASVDGMTNPFGLEVILNPDLVPAEVPSVLAHEWAHLAGHADEADASYVAWVTCLHGGPADQYSAWLTIFLLAVRHLPAEERASILGRLDPQPREHVRRIRDRLQRSQPVVRDISWRAYDQYLRANRVEGGIARYDDVLRLVLGGRRPDVR